MSSSSELTFSPCPSSRSDAPELASTALELEALQSIYGDQAFRLHEPSEQAHPQRHQANQHELEGRLRFEAVLPYVQPILRLAHADRQRY